MIIEGDVNPAASTTSDEKSPKSDTCTRYEVAAIDVFHTSVGESGILVVPAPGDTSVGADGGPAVVKLHAVAHGLS